MPDPDVIVIGAGHNGLICAAYLARSGLHVQVVERRRIAGGCAATEEMAPGVKVSRCFCDHVTLHTTPIPTELELERYGLENLSFDPFTTRLPLRARDWSSGRTSSERRTRSRSGIQKTRVPIDDSSASGE